MKKFIILFSLFFILTGCTVVRIDTTDIDNTINIILSKENKLYNRVGKGYKYYIPRGVTYIDTDELNDKLYSNGNYYYLYVDAVNYYYQTDIKYVENSNLYYSKSIDINGKKGYLQISEYEDKYLIEFVYNYAKMETIVSKEDINDAVLNCSYILSAVKFNHNLVKLMLNENYLTNREEKYDLFVAKKPLNNQIVYPDDDQDNIVDDGLSDGNMNGDNLNESDTNDVDNNQENKEEVE